MGISGNDFTTSQYDTKDFSLLVCQVHVSHLFIDYERHGFFRIGLLPIPVAEGVTIQVRSGDALANAFSALPEGEDSSKGAKRIEFLNLAIESFNVNQPQLTAGKAHFGRDGDLELFNVSIMGLTDGKSIKIPRATLKTTGPTVAQVYWKADGQACMCTLFKSVK